jgi:hypothetical protein
MPDQISAQQVVAEAMAAFPQQWKAWSAKALMQHPMAAYVDDNIS